MTSLSPASVPKREFFVRRRKYDGQCWLIAGTCFYEIDDLVDVVWRACTGDAPIGAIARQLGEERGMPPDAAATATANAVQLFLDLGLVQLTQDGGRRHGA